MTYLLFSNSTHINKKQNMSACCHSKLLKTALMGDINSSIICTIWEEVLTVRLVPFWNALQIHSTLCKSLRGCLTTPQPLGALPCGPREADTAEDSLPPTHNPRPPTTSRAHGHSLHNLGKSGEKQSLRTPRLGCAATATKDGAPSRVACVPVLGDQCCLPTSGGAPQADLSKPLLESITHSIYRQHSFSLGDSGLSTITVRMSPAAKLPAETKGSLKPPV